MTRVPAEYKEAHLRQIAVSEEFITYGLKQGHIRVLHRFSEARALLRGHTRPIADIRFVSDDIVVAGGQDGELYAWVLSVHDGDNAIHAEPILHVKFSPGCDASPVIISPIANKPEFAVAVGNAVMVLRPASYNTTQLEIDPLDPSPATEMPNFPVQDSPTTIAASRDGRFLAAGSKNGRVYVAAINPDGTLEGKTQLDVAGASRAPISSVEWLYTDETTSTAVLLVSLNSGAQQTLYATTDDGASFTVGDTVMLETSDSEPSFIHTEIVREQQLVLLADTPRKQAYTLHWSPAAPAGSAGVRFDYLARFKVGLPVLNFSAMWNPDEGVEGAVELNCVQTEAIQQYFLDPGLCSLETSEESRAVLSPRPAPAPVAAPAVLPVTPPAALPVSPAPAKKMETSADVAAVLPPSPLVNGAVTSADKDLEEEPERSESRGSSAQQRVTVVKMSESLEARLIQAMEVEKEECPSPPSSPAASNSAVVQIPVPISLPLEVDTSGASRSTSGQLPPAAVPAAQTPTKLLTPTDILRSSDLSTATAVGTNSTTPGAIKVLQRPVAVAPVPEPPMEAELPTPAGAMTEGFGTTAPGAPGVGESQGAVLASQPDVAAAVAKELSTVHRKFAGHVSAMYKELLKAMHTEISTQNVANQTLLREAVAAQADAVAEERAAVLSEERANMERLLAAISGTLNKDLPVRLGEVLRAELGTIAASVAASVAPAVQEAVAAALPKEAGAAVKSALEKQLATALQTSLTKPIQDSFRNAFTKQIVPSFENACQSMFVQMDKTLTKGLTEHVEASKSALSEPITLANTLKESLAEFNRLGGAGGSGEFGSGGGGGLVRTSSQLSSLRSPSMAEIKSELRAMVAQGRYEEAFSKALSMQDVGIVGWLCSQADAATVLSSTPPALSQMVLLSLVQQLAADIANNTANKLQWIREAALALNPQDPLLVPHLRPVLEQVHAALAAAVSRMQGPDVQSCKLAMHVVHSQMSS